ncbi:MAG: ABC transporter ATP-binding protein [Vallitalea sp.]|jgi:ABC-2 type transport system ATP-binding protein|nr:ABC transporter ATP-binding protein [Vallitalea sp.]
MDALRIKNLKKEYKGFCLKNINLTLPKGYILGYIGQNGAGKTTTLKLIMEEIKCDAGEVTVFGNKYNDDEIKFKNNIGYIADECYFPNSLTLKDLTKSLKEFYSSFDEHKFESYLEKWGLLKCKSVKELSKGMKTKLMFASVFSRDTKLLLLDEATSALDPVIRDEILQLLQEYISDGEKSVLFSTHIMSDLEKIADYIYFIDKGETILNDTKDNILENYLLLKGGNSDFTTTVKDKLIGYKNSSVGFEGLIRLNDKKYIDNGLLIETPSIDDIIIYHINGLRGNIE